ncbi:MAG: DUF3320 domain-containing protein [Deltaproteobacteria bacterium]|jgi:hypothetical protein|nr:DUF3320 domain-containing protein [Deltaproteobacteria bacterium]
MDDKASQELINTKLLTLRKKVLDLSARNPLVSVNLRPAASGTLRVVDEIPDVVVFWLRQQSAMRIVGLPPLEEDPADERTPQFKKALKAAIEERAKTAKAGKAVEQPEASEGALKVPLWERRLRNKIRAQLGLPERPDKSRPETIEAYARSLGIDPCFELPKGDAVTDQEALSQGVPDSRHDRDIQTLMLSDDLERKLGNMLVKYRTFQEETGLGVLFAAVGLLKWTGPKSDGSEAYSPILMLPLRLECKKSRSGAVYQVNSDGEDIYLNFVLAEMFRSRYNAALPPFEPDRVAGASGPVASYLDLLADNLAKGAWGRAEVLNQVVLGLFPYDGMAIYEDLDPSRDWYRKNPMIKDILIGRDPEQPPAPGAAGASSAGPAQAGSTQGGSAQAGPAQAGGATAAGAASPSPAQAGTAGASPAGTGAALSGPGQGSEIPDAAELGLVLSADSSQVKVITDLLGGRSLAVEGPPGTGKSQTIVNAIALALSQGKKVLFIAEKLAALEVVKSRLEAIGLGDYLLPLQANRSSRAQVMDSIRRRLEAAKPPEPAEPLETLLSQYMERKTFLESYSALMDAPYEKTGIAVADILGRHLATSSLLTGLEGASKAVPKDPESFDKPAIDNLRSKGDELQKAFNEAEGKDLWENLKIESLNKFAADNILESAGEAAALAQDWADKERALRAMAKPASLGPDGGPAVSEEILTFLGHGLSALASITPPPDSKILLSLLQGPGKKGLAEFLDSADKYRKEAHSLAQVFDPESPESLALVDKVLSAAKEGELKEVAPERLEAEKLSLSGSLSALIADAQALAPAAEAEPRLRALSLSSIRKLGSLARKCGREALSLRDKLPPAPQILADAKRVLELSDNLRIERARLAQAAPRAVFFPGPRAPVPGGSVTMREADPDSDDALRARAETLEAAGLLSFLSASFREAKSWWKNASSLPFKAQEAAELIRGILAWRSKAWAFESDAALRNLAGALTESPQGALFLDSPALEVLRSLSTYYEALLAAFPSPSQKAAFDTGAKAGTEILLSVPEKINFAEEIVYSDIEKRLSRLKDNLEVLNQAQEEIRSLGFKPLAPVSASELSSWRNRTVVNLAIKARLEGSESISEALGSKFLGPLTASDSLAPELAALEALESYGWTALSLAALYQKAGPSEAKKAIDEILAARSLFKEKIKAIFEQTGTDFAPKLEKAPAEAQAALLRDASKDSDGLFARSALAGAGAELIKLGYEANLAPLAEMAKKAPSLGRVLEAALYGLLARRIFGDPQTGLNRFLDGRLDKARSDLSALDGQIMKAAQASLKRKLFLAANPPAGVGSGLKSGWTEMALLQKEAGKKKNLLGLRKLVPQAAKALLELKPCWMMSPTAVSQYLVGESVSFDLAILDEASQMPPQNAIPSLARCRTSMITGDLNQLPPTTFFKKQLADEETDDDLESEDPIEESILEMASTVFTPKVGLKWHYRSKHSALIEFSNQNIYQNSLVVFPSPSERRPGMGVELIETGGLYKQGQNEIEAEAMVREAIAFMKAYPSRSLGLVTLNQKQMELILSKLDKAIAQDEAAEAYELDWQQRSEGLERLFVKNLENVQGDERDCIFIGTVYGPETLGGPVPNRFGPILGVAGRRRLNVLFTRAKERIVTFTSMTPDDIKASDDDDKGVGMLKRWLKYSKDGGLAAKSAPIDAKKEMSLRGYVGGKLSELGYDPEPSVGTEGYRLNLALKSSDGQSYRLGLEADGQEYRRERSIRDRDVLRDVVLKNLGWTLSRLWTPDWINRPDKELGKLSAILAEKEPEPERAAEAGQKAAGPGGAAASDQASASPPAPSAGGPAPLADGSAPPSSLGPSALAGAAGQQPATEEGDLVALSFAGDPESIVVYIIGDEDAEIEGKLVKCARPRSPLGRAAMGASVDDEIEFLAGSVTKLATVVNIVKGVRPPPAPPAPPDAAEEAKLEMERAAAYDPKEADPYDEGRTEELSAWLCLLIDKEGPIRLDWLCKQAAQSHNFARTTQKLKSRVIGVLSGRRAQKDYGDGEPVFWPRGAEPVKSLKYRRLDSAGKERPWEVLPYPERLGLAEEAVEWSGPAAFSASVGYMLKKLGLSSAKPALREELMGFVRLAAAGSGSATPY